MGQILIKINQNGTDTIEVDQTYSELVDRLQAKGEFLYVTVEGYERLYNKSYIVSLHGGGKVEEHDATEH